MKPSHHSPTEDVVDRYNHTWGVVLLLTISATTWLLPQLPHVQQSISQDAPVSRRLPRFVASCWPPAHFTSAMISYAHASCGSAFNRAITNLEDLSNETSEPASLYYPVDPQGEVYAPELKGPFRPITTDKTTRQAHSQPAMTGMYSRILLITFILAVCLKLPYILWSLVSSCSDAGPVQILRSIQAAQFMDEATRDQTNQEILQAISLTKHKQSYTSCVLYLSFKLLTITVAIIGFFVVISQQSQKSGTFDNKADASLSKTVTDYSNTILLCGFSIVHMQNIQTFTMQCVFHPETSSDTSNASDTAEHDSMYVRLYDVLHTTLAVFFAVLAALNGLNFLVWVAKLVPGPLRNLTFSNNQLPPDVYLILLMARQNVGFLAAKNLELGLSSEFRGEAKVGEELRNLTE